MNLSKALSSSIHCPHILEVLIKIYDDADIDTLVGDQPEPVRQRSKAVLFLGVRIKSQGNASAAERASAASASFRMLI
jgi:hypothetical protein